MHQYTCSHPISIYIKYINISRGSWQLGSSKSFSNRSLMSAGSCLMATATISCSPGWCSTGLPKTMGENREGKNNGCNGGKMGKTMVVHYCGILGLIDCDLFA